MAKNDATGTATTPSAKPRRGRRNVMRLVAVLTLLVAGGAAVFAFLPDPPALAAASALSGKTVTTVSTGGDHSCALTSDGDVACWGSNNHGQLGTNSTTARSLPTAITTTGTPLSGKTITQLSVNGSHTCALTSDAILACWGDDSHGQIGDGSTSGDHLVPTAVTTASTPLSGKTISAVTTGSAHTCALASDGTLACWGLQTDGRLGNSSSSAADVETPTAVTVSGTALSGLTINAIDAGAAHTCARASSNALACWGLNTSGQLGNGSTTSSNEAVAVTVSSTPLASLSIAGISAGGAHTCAVSVSGVVACWGENGDNELGNGGTTDSDVPVSPTLASTPIATATILSVSSGDKNTCVVATGGSISCWGNNSVGSVGDNTNTTRDVPTAIVTSGTILSGKSLVFSSVGDSTVCALASDGTPACWGDNTLGKIGDGTTTNQDVATAVITNPSASITEVTGQRSGVLGYGRPGDAIVLSGSWWNGSKASTDFVVTVGGETADQTLETNSTGTLSGGITVPAAAALGSGSVVITQGTDSVTKSFYILGSRTVTVSPTSGLPGTVVSVSGTNFDPTAAAEIRGLTSTSGPTASSDAAVDVTITSGGSVPATNFTVDDFDTVSIEVREKSPGGTPSTDYARAAFTVPPVTVSATAVSGQRSGVTGYGRPTEVLTVTGANWPNDLVSSDFTAAFCNTSGGSCDSNATKTLATNGSGVLSGTVTVPSDATTGARALKVTHDGRSALFNFGVLGTRSVTLSPTSGGLSTPVSVTGTNFDPLAFVSIKGVRVLSGPVYSSDSSVPGFTAANGSLSAVNFIVEDPLTTYIQVSEDAPSGTPATDRAYASFTTLTATLAVDTVTGQRTGVNGYARAGDAVNVSGSGWAASRSSGTITALFCAADGSGCDTAATNGLSTNSSGDITGSVTVPTGATTGSRSLKVLISSGSAFTPIKILSARTVTLSNSTGAVGSSVTVTAANFDPGAAVQIKLAKTVTGSTPVYTADTPVNATISETGTLAATSFTVSTPGAVVVVETAPDGDPSVDWASAPFSSLVPGTTLSMRSFITGSNSTNTGIDFGSLTSPNKPTPIAGDLNRIQVVDQRYGAYGWSLTATMSNFVGAAVSMNKSTVSLSPTCVAVGTNSAPGLTAGGASQSFASPVALCAKDTQAGASGNTSGAYNIDASVVLTIPAFQRADVYSAIITITLA